SPIRLERPVADVYDDGCLRVEHDNYLVTCKGTQVSFTKTEFLLVSRLARNIDRVVRAQALWEHAWGSDTPLNLQCLHVFFYRLRRKLQPFGLRIENRINIGYALAHGQCCDRGESCDAPQPLEVEGLELTSG
ncbi:MAG: helix-turn-helix domain-containing protein, partial [Rubrivivax sp.]|nr:helix-turn-helix domain-containing protein [Pyrinomonadaceae bacterium]